MIFACVLELMMWEKSFAELIECIGERIKLMEIIKEINNR